MSFRGTGVWLSAPSFFEAKRRQGDNSSPLPALTGDWGAATWRPCPNVRHVVTGNLCGEVAEWLKAADCKSARASVRWFESSPLHHRHAQTIRGMVEHGDYAQTIRGMVEHGDHAPGDRASKGVAGSSKATIIF